MHHLEALNKEQRDAAATIYGPLLVLAGAGTGKTKVITTRIAWMLAQNIPPEAILAVSFTNKAAREMKERLCTLYNEKEAKKVELSTFHSFTLGLLRSYAREFQISQHFTIADEGESKALLREVLRENNLEELISLQDAAAKISFYKDSLYDEETFSKQYNVFDRKIMALLFRDYNRKLRLYNLVDFDDLVYLAALGLKKNSALLESIQNKYRYLMVDEFQDTNNAQFQVIRLIGQKYKNVCVVGDDDQSIYSWRGAKPAVISDFLREFSGAKKITLEQNYRCSPNILQIANSVIRENPDRIGKELWSKQDNRHPVHIRSCENEKDEALFIAENIKNIQAQNSSISFENFAILVRSNSQSVPLEETFIQQKIPYIIHGGTKFFDRKEVRDLFSYLRLANNPDDINSFFRIVNLPARGIGVTTLERVKERYLELSRQKENMPLQAAIKSVAREHKNLALFYEQWLTCAEKFKGCTAKKQIAATLQECFESLGLKKEILTSSTNMQVAQFRIDMVEKVISVIENLHLPKESLAEIIDSLHLDETPFDKSKESKGKVQIMTIHASKGLEFPNVFLVGVEDNILPHERSHNMPGGEQEERRLFYVAITRAKERLFISHCGFRSRGKVNHGGEREPKPSRFLSAIPAHLIMQSESDPLSVEARRMEAARKLFELFR